MKTAISLPDEVFASAERVAEEMGISRSELYVTALKEFLEKHIDVRVTESLNQVYGEEKAIVDPLFKAAQARVLRKNKW